MNDLNEAATWMWQYFEGEIKIKGKECIFEAMQHYQNSQLENDIPMQKLIEASSTLKEKISDLWKISNR